MAATTERTAVIRKAPAATGVELEEGPLEALPDARGDAGGEARVTRPEGGLRPAAAEPAHARRAVGQHDVVDDHRERHEHG